MAKYDSLRKLERNRLLVEYYQSHPEASLREIGELFNISPQRVWELVKAHEERAIPQPDGMALQERR